MLKKHIPNAITSGNLLCGCIAVVKISNGELLHASLLVLLAAFLDFFDGMSARLLKVGSPLGAQLDSLADMVSFGFVPSYIAFSLLQNAEIHPILKYIPFLIAIFSAIRLAKFNIDDRQKTSFIGLPTPANALLWISIPLITWQNNSGYGFIETDFMLDFFYSQWVIIGLSVLMSYLLVAELPLLALKFKSLNFQLNKTRWILIAISITLLFFLFFAAIPIILILYLVLSVIENKTNKQDEI